MARRLQKFAHLIQENMIQLDRLFSLFFSLFLLLAAVVHYYITVEIRFPKQRVLNTATDG